MNASPRPHKLSPAAVAAARAELESIIHESWSIYKATGDSRDEELARSMEVEARAILACLPRPKKKQNKRSPARKLARRGKRVDQGASIMSQVRSLVHL